MPGYYTNLQTLAELILTRASTLYSMKLVSCHAYAQGFLPSSSAKHWQMVDAMLPPGQVSVHLCEVMKAKNLLQPSPPRCLSPPPSSPLARSVTACCESLLLMDPALQPCQLLSDSVQQMVCKQR